MDKIVKARKDHRCSHCDGKIKRSEKYHYGEWREPVYAEAHGSLYGTQTGIKYVRYRLCDTCDGSLSKQSGDL